MTRFSDEAARVSYYACGALHLIRDVRTNLVANEKQTIALNTKLRHASGHHKLVSFSSSICETSSTFQMNIII